MSVRGATLHASAETVRADNPSLRPPGCRSLVLGTFLMGITEFVVAGLLPEIAGDLPLLEHKVADAAQAHRLLEDRRTIGKILLSTGN
ncbi:hypothetical protein [Streptomyces sp. NPDC058155]|uniref:hypothetical protein n=1 Tax=Streptomyces sp. NPDC058155 TaxID=3346359 RepID=UPI0036E6D4AE